MTHPEFWGWSTGPLTIRFWGWENASDLKERFACAPRVVHGAQLPCVVLDLPRQCIVASVESPLISVLGYYQVVTVASAPQATGICCDEAAQLVSSGRAIPKVQNNPAVEKVVKGKALIPSPMSAWPAAVCGPDQRRVPRISI